MIKQIFGAGCLGLMILQLAGCTTVTQPIEQQPIEFINGHAIRQNFQDQFLQLKEAGQLVPMTKLQEQLNSRKSCALSLPTTKAKAQGLSEVYQQARESTVLVGGLFKCGKCPNWHPNIASGFFITADGVVCTNYHVVNNKMLDTLVIMDAGGVVYPVQEVLAASEADDIALLRVEVEKAKPLTLVDQTPVGTTACLVSHPRDNYFMFTSGIVSRYFTEMSRTTPESRAIVDRMAITAEFAGGSSGAAILDDQGNAIGMVTATDAIHMGGNDPKRPRTLQMVLRICVPARSLQKLVK